MPGLSTSSVETAPITPVLKGGVSAIISGGISTIGVLDTTTTVAQINPLIWEDPLLYFSSIPSQVAGFVPLYPCNYFDCRLVPQRNCYSIKVFGNQTGNVSTYENDMNSFFVQWNGYTPQFVIMKRQDSFFGAKSNLDTWQTMATISNNAYGLYYPQGTIPNNPTWAGFTVNWGAVIAKFGTGFYKIGVNGCVSSGGAQATLTVPISNSGFPNSVVGTFTIGTLVLAINYNGSYTGYLTYLSGLINASGKFTATITNTGLIVSGINYNISNGLVIKQSINVTPGDTSVQTGSQSLSGVGVVTIDNNPQLFPTINYNIGSAFNTGIWTCPSALNGKTVTFSGSIQGAAQNNSGYNVYLAIVANIWRNGGLLEGDMANATGNPTTSGTLNYSFPLVVHTGDQIKIEFSLQGTTSNANNNKTVTLQGGTFIASSTSVYSNTTFGNLSGGIAQTVNCQCALVTPQFELWGWNCIMAAGTVKFESWITGAYGSALYEGTVYNFNGYTIYDSIRCPGFFGYWEPKFDKVINEWGTSTQQELGTMDLVRDKIVPNWKFKGFPAPLWLHKNLAYYGFMANASKRLLVSDYNLNNSDWNIKQKSVIAQADYKPAYLTPGNFPLDEIEQERMITVEVAFQDGIQSGIMSQFGI